MGSAVLTQHDERKQGEPSLAAHVVFLTGYIPPYFLPVYSELAQRLRRLTILISTPMESNRKWKPQWGTLDVVVQRTLTLERPWKHPTGFSESASIHVPWDTLGRLWSLRPDVVISGQFGIRSLLSALYASVTRTPLVLFVNLSEHQERGRGWVRHLLRRWLIRRASCVAVSGHSGARYLRSLGTDPRRIVYVPYIALPTVCDGAQDRRAPQQAHKLLYVGQLIERKGLLPFVAALGRWAGQNPQHAVEFDLVGSGPLEHALRSCDLPSNVHMRLLGERDVNGLAACYSNSGILALPTLSDEWGLVVNEALAAGMPVLGSVYSQAVDELCVEGQTGWRFRTDESSEMEEAIDRALNTPVEMLDAMRVAARERVKKLTPAYGADRFVVAIQVAIEGRNS